ncbi:MAG: sulfatase-like hydrolase/transferase, partial [Deltaproteobacteria bacterium]|nr:sulfatase-like hydrolase/transferase [Deltaproteobacteria bacterium]
MTARWSSGSRAIPRSRPVSVLLIVVSCLSIALLAGAVSCRRTTPLGEPRVIAADVHQVILITIDALRSDALSPGPDGESWTPAIDALASHSLVFSQARTPAPWTLASFSSMMTGFPVTVHQAKKFKSKLPEELPTLAEHMSEAGYWTAAAGVNVYLKPETGLARGFDEYHFFVHEWYKGKKRKPPFLKWLEPKYRKKEWYNGTPVLTEFALRWLQENRDRGFFLWLHYLDPHVPYYPPPG